MSGKDLRILVDHREPEKIVYGLRGMGMSVERTMLSVADYVISSDCAVERKTVHDFAESIFDGRLFEQARALKDSYSGALLVLEGSFELESVLQRNPRALWGAMLKLEIDASLPIFPSPSFQTTIDILYTLTKRISNGQNGEIRIQNKPRLLSNQDWQTFVIASLPGVGDKLARRLLAHFGSVRSVIRAEKEQFVEVEGIGARKAARVSDLLDSKFDG
jgi:ERCC4-type nuclease